LRLPKKEFTFFYYGKKLSYCLEQSSTNGSPGLKNNKKLERSLNFWVGTLWYQQDLS